jgi:hypothetical protein
LEREGFVRLAPSIIHKMNPLSMPKMRL